VLLSCGVYVYIAIISSGKFIYSKINYKILIKLFI